MNPNSEVMLAANGAALFNELGGNVQHRLRTHGYNQNSLRTYSLPVPGRFNADGSPVCAGTYITKNVGPGGTPMPVLISNAPSTMTRDDWILIDRAIMKVAQPRLKVVNFLRSRGMVLNIPNAMSKTVVESRRMSDISDATISMNAIRESYKDRPVNDMVNIPLPIIHKDFEYYSRELAVSRNGQMPLDTSTGELAARKVAEYIEKMTIGITGYTGFSYGGGTIYGMLDIPFRITQVLTDPTSTGWTPKVLVNEVLSMRAKSVAEKHYGPWVLFVSTAWDAYFDEDYSDDKGDNTLRERLEKIRDIVSVETVDYLTGFDIVLVQLTTDVMRLLNGMDITTIQWETHGGLQQHFKVMAIQVPEIREDFNGNTGIVHGSVPP